MAPALPPAACTVALVSRPVCSAVNVCAKRAVLYSESPPPGAEQCASVTSAAFAASAAPRTRSAPPRTSPVPAFRTRRRPSAVQAISDRQERSARRERHDSEGMRAFARLSKRSASKADCWAETRDAEEQRAHRTRCAHYSDNFDECRSSSPVVATSGAQLQVRPRHSPVIRHRSTTA